MWEWGSLGLCRFICDPDRRGEGVFDQANYSGNALALDTLTEQQHIHVFFAAGFTVLFELSSALLLGLAGLESLCRRR